MESEEEECECGDIIMVEGFDWSGLNAKNTSTCCCIAVLVEHS